MTTDLTRLVAELRALACGLPDWQHRLPREAARLLTEQAEQLEAMRAERDALKQKFNTADNAAFDLDEQLGEEQSRADSAETQLAEALRYIESLHAEKGESSWLKPPTTFAEKGK